MSASGEPPPAGSEPAPIFIIGTGRSGTTLLRLMLCAHPRIYICHETSFYIWNRVLPRRRSGEEFAEYYFRTFSFRFLRLRPEQVLAGLPRPLSRQRLGALFRAVMREKARSYGRIRYGDKTPGHAGSLAQIYRDFPDAKVIHIVRDPRATLLSLSRMPWAAACDYANAVLYDVERKQVGPFLDRVLQVHLETLLENPGDEMRRILEWLDEPWDDAVLDHSNHLPDSNDMPDVPWLSTAQRPRGAATLRWQDLPALRIRTIEFMCRKSMKAWGYEPAELESPPSGFRVFWSALKQLPEAIRFAWVYGRLGLRNRNPKTLDDATGRKLFRRLNPGAWAHYPGLEMPEPPLPEDPPLAAAPSAGGDTAGSTRQTNNS